MVALAEAALALAGGLYAAAVAVLAVLAGQTLVLAGLRAALPARPLPRAPLPAPAPGVVVQLPVYDEPPALVARALDAALALRWPGPLAVQLLDDSPPDGRAANAALVRARAAAGRVEHIVRDGRAGFKAGALAAGLARSDAPLAAVFDVDFRPGPDFLEDAAEVLLADARLAFVQAPWAHPDAGRTPLGRAQAVLLDLHFGVEQAARDRAGLALPFNGTAGLWRRDAIEAAGGWQGDTLAEDLDLALRAHLAGWRARLLARPVDADLPPTLAAWRAQQTRWAKGLAEVGRKLGPRVARSALPRAVRLAALGQFGVAAALPALLALVALHPVVALAAALGADAVPPWADALGLAAVGAALAAHGVAQAARPGGAGLAALPLGLIAPVAVAWPAARGVAQALGGRRTPFERTAKTVGSGRPGGRGAAPGEAAFAAWSAAGALALAAAGAWPAAVVQAAFAVALAAAVRPAARAAVVREPCPA